MDYYQIGQNIRHYRRNQGLTQEQLAEIINISVPHMSHIETGNTKLSLSVLVNLSDALKVSVDDLLSVRSSVSMEEKYTEVIKILEECDSTELKILTDIILGAKNALKKYKA